MNKIKPESRRKLQKFHFVPTPGLVGLLLVVLLTGYGTNKVLHFLMNDSMLFTVEAIKVSGVQYLSQEEILSLIFIKEGTPLFQVSEEEVTRMILKNPYVRAVSVSRALPATLLIDVQERQPVFYLVDRRIYMVDETGIILLKKPRMPLLKLPIVTGLSVPQMLKDRTPVYNTLNLLKKINEVDPALLGVISEFHFEDGNWPRLYLIRGGAQVELGENHHYQRLYALSELIKKTTLVNELEHIKRIDLTFKDRIIVEQKS